VQIGGSKMAATPVATNEATALVREIQPERTEFEKHLSTLRTLDGTELAQAGRLGQHRIAWVKDLDTKAAEWTIAVTTRLAPGKKKAYDAWKEWTRLEEELVAPAKAIREKARPLIGQYQLELNRQAEVEAARLREEQRKAEEEQRRAQEEEAARLRAEAEKLVAEGDTAAADEKQLEAEFVASQPIVPVAVTAQQVARPKVDQGHVVYWRRLVNPHLFLNWVIREIPVKALRILPRPDDSSETVVEAYDWTLTLKFGNSWKTKDATADMPGIVITKGYQAVARSRR
jgi:hypothetical protein